MRALLVGIAEMMARASSMGIAWVQARAMRLGIVRIQARALLVGAASPMARACAVDIATLLALPGPHIFRHWNVMVASLSGSLGMFTGYPGSHRAFTEPSVRCFFPPVAQEHFSCISFGSLFDLAIRQTSRNQRLVGGFGFIEVLGVEYLGCQVGVIPSHIT